MNYSSAISFSFRGPNAWRNIGFMLLCFLIPIVGPIVIFGYLIGAEKILIGNIYADPPAFDFGKFSPYLTRGLYPFLASLVLGLIISAVIFPVVIAFIVAFALAQNNTGIIVVLIVLAVVAYFGIIALFSTLAPPLIFKCGLEGNFQAAFDWRFLLGYLKRVGWLSLGVHFLAMLMSFALIFSICIPFVGPYAALAVFNMFQAHLNTQLYLIYLERGGPPLAIKPDPLDQTGFPVLASPASGDLAGPTATVMQTPLQSPHVPPVPPERFP